MNDACYCPSNGNIYGVSGPYVIQCNGTTGRREDYVRVGSPLYGDMRICYHAATNKIYVATMWQPSNQQSAFTWVNDQRDIFEVALDLSTSTGLGVGALDLPQPPYSGYGWIASNGNYLYYRIVTATNVVCASSIVRRDPTNLADTSFNTGGNIFQAEQWAIDNAGDRVLVTDSNNRALRVGNLALSSDNFRSILPYNAVGVGFCNDNSKFYVVTGDTTMLRMDDTVVPNFTPLNLGVVEATADPCRVRYWPLPGTQKLYLPCMTSNTVIVWDPVTDTGEAKTGFENPVDVVFTNSKAFAVQNSAIGLREIN